LEGNLREFEKKEMSDFQEFIEKKLAEELEDGDRNPVVYGKMPYTHFELTGLNKVSFNVADDPFFKAQNSKYFPECVVINKQGEIKDTLNPSQKSSTAY
jgi:hypothetical protein